MNSGGMKVGTVSAHLKISAAMCIIGSFVVVNKLMIERFPVFLASEIRLLIGALFLLSILRWKERRWPRLTARDASILFMESLIGVFVFSLCLLYGLRTTSAMEAGMITSTVPAAVAIVAVLLFKEKVTKYQLCGILLAVMGASCINVLGNGSPMSDVYRSSLPGNLLVLGAVCGEAIFITLGKLVSERVSPLSISAYVASIGALLFMPGAIYESVTFPFEDVTVQDWLLLAYAGVIVTALAVLLLNQGMRNTSGGSVAVLTALMPMSSVVLAIAVLQEPFHPYHAAGIALVTGSILLISRPSIKSRPNAKERGGLKMNLDSIPVLETERLILRRMSTADAREVFDLFSDAAVTKDVGIEPFAEIRQAEQLIYFMNRLFEEKKAFRWGIIKKDDHTLIGTCGFNGWEMSRGARGEIGYDLKKRYWRQGYMTEAITRVIQFGFITAGLHRIEAFTNLDAFPSIQFLQRMGFTEEGVLRGYARIRGEYTDQRCFSLVRNEWTVR